MIGMDKTEGDVNLSRHRKAWRREHFEARPDIRCLGKGLGGGIFPVAAMTARKELDQAQDRSLGHYTHEKSPVGAAAALAVIRVIEEEMDRALGILEESLKRVEGQGARSRERGAGSREHGAGSMEQGAWSREHGAGSREQGAKSRSQRAAKATGKIVEVVGMR